MSLEYLIEDLIDTLDEGLKRLKNLNECDVELYNHIWGDEENNDLVSSLKLNNLILSDEIDDLIHDIEYESRKLKKSNFDDNKEPLPTKHEWVMDTLNDIDVNGKNTEEVYNQVFSKLADNAQKGSFLINPFIHHFKVPEFRWDTDPLLDQLDANIYTMLNDKDYQHLVELIDSIPFQMPRYNIELEDEEHFSVSDRIAAGLICELEPIADMVVEYVNSKDLDTDQEEDMDI